MVGWIESHGFEALLIYYGLAAIMGGMPTPGPDASIAYRWIFSTFSTFSANIARVVATQFPSTKTGLSGQASESNNQKG